MKSINNSEQKLSEISASLNRNTQSRSLENNEKY